MTQKTKIQILLILTFFSMKGAAQSSFYDLNTIQKIEITFTQPNWDYMLDTAKAGSDGYISASKVKINGVEFSNVGVKYKGNSSYNPTRNKNPFHIELDTYVDQNYLGYTDIKLSNAYRDPSFLREVLSYKIASDYMHVPQSNYANVYVNTKLIGLYSNTESVGKKFVKNRFGSKSNTFVKCSPVNGADPGSLNYPNLVYLGPDSSLYFERYELESDYGWDDLVNLCDTLNNHIDAIEEIVNMNEVLWMLAFDNVLVNLDSYIGQFSQNYYLYKDDHDRFRPVLWDLNESFGTFSETGTGNLNTTTSRIQMSPLLHSDHANWPLVKNILANPTYKRMYIANMRTILAEHFINNSYYSDALAFRDLINASVKADPNKFYSYYDFRNNILSDINVGNGIAPGLTNLMDGRKGWLSNIADFTASQPVVSEISVSNASPEVGDVVSITAKVTNASASGVFLAYRYDVSSPFKLIPMYDNGLNGDGASNDLIYGSVIIISSGAVDYYLYAENSNAGVFSPQRAEMDFYKVNTKPPASKDLVINEFLASNTVTMADQNGEYDDWIEIFNNSNESVSMDNIYLSDSYTDLHKWKFPDDIIMSPKSYLIVWADDNTSQSGLHAGFKLSATNEQIALTHGVYGIIDSVTFYKQFPDISMQRCPDGYGEFVTSVPTYNSENCITTGVDHIVGSVGINIYPNPFSERVVIDFPNGTINTVRIIDLMGETVYREEGFKTNNLELCFDQIPQGIYVIIINNSIRRKIIKEP
jgi:hypothetical protein